MTFPASVAAGRADLLALHAALPERYPALLESAAFHPRIGKRSLLLAFPGAPIVSTAGRDFFAELDDAHHALSKTEAFGMLTFIGYESLTVIENVRVPLAGGPLPDAFAMPVGAAVIVDRVADTLEVVGEPAAVAEVERDLARLAPSTRQPRRVAQPPALSVEEEDPARYVAAVLKAKEYIRAGDIFQANLSRLWQARVPPAFDAVALYEALREANPAPFAGIVRWQDSAIVSSSPERLVRAREGRIDARPIAGTRPRTGPDGSMIADLIANEKERAEHIMLVDLVRNDLGRIARYGSVEVDELMAIETYAHVHHIVSNVRCEPVTGVTPGAVLKAVFPGGTITGCPKVRCMEIIAELEGAGRGAYTGSIGYIERDGSFDFNILIRTMVWEPGQITFRAGAGIVADSEPGAELAETRAKALGMLRALGAA